MGALAFCDLDCSSYKSLSFRIGADSFAAFAAENGRFGVLVVGQIRFVFSECSHGLVNVYHD